ncbi:MAG TPA: GNAT family N-acetyltransferase [Nocardioidaceae bacterium]|nr:GNAT family N-acetyltransferase [Nocardioidaceae bacterium]
MLKAVTAPPSTRVVRPDFPLRTERLLIRPLTLEDVDALHAYRSIPEVCRFVPFEPMDKDEIAARIGRQWASRELTDDGQVFILGVEVVESGIVVGDVMLAWSSREHATGEIGWIQHPEHSGHGYATEAARALLELGFDGIGLHRMMARLDERNEASTRLCQRLGMRQEARLVENEWFKGEWTNELDFAILDYEWRALDAG